MSKDGKPFCVRPPGPREGVACMDPWECVVITCLGLFLGMGLGYAASRFVDRLCLQSAQASVAEIGVNARKEAENIVKEAELKAKDEVYRKREDFNREIEQSRGEIREQERRL